MTAQLFNSDQQFDAWKKSVPHMTPEEKEAHVQLALHWSERRCLVVLFAAGAVERNSGAWLETAFEAGADLKIFLALFDHGIRAERLTPEKIYMARVENLGHRALLLYLLEAAGLPKDVLAGLKDQSPVHRHIDPETLIYALGLLPKESESLENLILISRARAMLDYTLHFQDGVTPEKLSVPTPNVGYSGAIVALLADRLEEVIAAFKKDGAQPFPVSVFAAPDVMGRLGLLERLKQFEDVALWRKNRASLQIFYDAIPEKYRYQFDLEAVRAEMQRLDLAKPSGDRKIKIILSPKKT